MIAPHWARARRLAAFRAARVPLRWMLGFDGTDEISAWYSSPGRLWSVLETPTFTAAPRPLPDGAPAWARRRRAPRPSPRRRLPDAAKYLAERAAGVQGVVGDANWSPHPVAAMERTVAALAEVGRAVEVEERKASLAREIEARYGVTVHRGRFGRAELILSPTDRTRLEEDVMHDPRLDAIGRGWYLGAGGEIEMRTAPEWTLRPLDVSTARLVARILRPFTRLLRHLTRKAS